MSGDEHPRVRAKRGPRVGERALPVKITQQLQHQILQGYLEKGERLPSHRELASVFGVSLGTIREALSMLQTAGLIEAKIGDGTYVADWDEAGSGVALPSALTRSEFIEIAEAREAVERQTAMLAAGRSDADGALRLRRIADRMLLLTADPQAFIDADLEFHEVMAELSRNRFLLRFVRDLSGGVKHVARSTVSEMPQPRMLRTTALVHRRLAEVIGLGDVESAGKIIGDLVASHLYDERLQRLTDEADSGDV